MDGEPTPIDSIERIQISTAALYRAAPILVPMYGLALSLVYLLCYWGWFDVNVFSYLSAADIALAAMYGVLPIAAGIIIGIVGSFGSSPSTSRSVSTLTGADYLLIVLFLGAVAGLVYHSRPWIGVASALFTLAIAFKPLLRRAAQVTTSKLAAFTAFFAVCTLVLVAGFATTSALRISHGACRELVELRGPVLSVPSSSEMCHLGHVGDYDFFSVSGSRAILRVPSDAIDELKFVKRRGRVDPPPITQGPSSASQ